MKKYFIFLGLILFTSIPVLYSQPVFYGCTYQGGGGSTSLSVIGDGTIYKLNAADNSFSSVYRFSTQNPGQHPTEELIQLPDGKIYGMTSGGGLNGEGVIFSFNPLNNTFTKVYDFDRESGSFPQEGLTRASDDKLYGVTRYGQGIVDGGYGTIFSFDPNTNTHTKLFDFDDANGSEPSGSLIQASDGILYGTTYAGGTTGKGTIFSFDPDANAFTKLHDFDGANGSAPKGRLTQASDGKLYGTTTSGGLNEDGTIFSFDPTKKEFKKEFDFSDLIGAYPTGGLIQLENGKLYGTTFAGGTTGSGTIFSFDPGSKIFSQLEEFTFEKGRLPNGLALASDGKFYGTTQRGSELSGIDVMSIFSFDPLTNELITLKNISEGRRALGTLIQGSDGKLYGTAWGGWRTELDNGIIFSFDIPTKDHAALFKFGFENGLFPSGNLIELSNGKLYSVTVLGGINHLGTISSFDPLTNTHSKLYDFDGTNGRNPVGLIKSSDGRLYGTSGGGVNGYGTIFSFDVSTNTYTKLFEFDGTNGANPGRLVTSVGGKLYGTSGGGVNGYGTIFTFDVSTNTYKKLYEFDGSSGADPSSKLTYVSDGKFYGTTSAGGLNDRGTIYSFDLSTNTHTKLFDFENVINGILPGNLVEYTDGLLYGTTQIGGAYGPGTIFSFDPSMNKHTKLVDFDGSSGNYPQNLIMASDGKLYGTTINGVSGIGEGAIFSYDPATGNFEKLQDFSRQNGLRPAGELLEYTSCTPEVCDGIDNDCDGLIDEDCGSPDLPKVYIGNTRVIEGDHGNSKAVFILWLDRKPEKTIKLRYKTVDQTAKSPEDYFSKSGEITFGLHTLVKTIFVQVKGDNQPEPSETFKVVLENLENANPGKIEGVATIIDDDFHSFFSDRKDPKFLDPNGNPNGGNNWQAHVLPNPSSSRFQLDILGETGGTILLRVTDIAGRVIEERNLDANTRQVWLGEKWKQGSYILELTSGTERRTIQLVKLK